MLSLLILVPLMGIIILNLFYKFTVRRISFWFALALFTLQLLVAILNRQFYYGSDIDFFSSFIRVNLHMDQISFIVLLCIQIVCLTSLIVSRYTLTDADQRFNFINLLIIASVGMSGMVITRDIFSLYVFLEVATVSSFILIAFRRGREALEGAFKYIMLSTVASVLMLSAAALILLASGSTAFDAVRMAVVSGHQSRIILIAVAMFLAGIFIKSGLVPFHGWLPDAYSSAPSAVSVLLAGIVTKACGVYTLIRFVAYIFSFDKAVCDAVLVIGVVSVLAGALAALSQTDLKRMLAYSSISQVGYIILGVGCANAAGLCGALFHFFNHSIFKSLLFVNAASVSEALPTTDMGKMGGLSARMPVTGVTSVAGALSASGVPPFAGFWSKLLIVLGLWQSFHYAYAVVAVLSSVLTLAYLLMMQRNVFFGKLKSGLEGIKEAPLGISIISIVLALVSLGAGVLFPVVYNTLLLPVKGIFNL